MSEEKDILLQVLIEKIDKLDTKLDTHMEVESKKINELVETFNTAKHVVWFIKWAAVVTASLATAIMWVVNTFSIGIK